MNTQQEAVVGADDAYRQPIISIWNTDGDTMGGYTR